MEKVFCHYHYQSPATWECRQCQTKFGDCCLDQQKGGYGLTCPLCARDLFSLGAANVIEPFWVSVNRFLAYPFKTSALAVIFILSILSTLLTAGFLGIGVGLSILAVSMRYAYAIIESASMGRRSPPSFTIIFQRDPDFLFLKQIVVLIIASAFLALILSFGSVALAMLARVIIFAALPASILLLAIEKSIIAAVSPRMLFVLILNMGAGYWVLYAFVNILINGPYYILAYFADWIPEALYIPFSVGSTLYFTFSAAYMMGYALLQYQKELGYRADLESDDNDPLAANLNPATESMKEINILLIEGRYQDAYSTLKQASKDNPDDLSIQLRLNALMAGLGKEDALLEYSEALIEKLCKANCTSQAAKVFVDTCKAVPGFQLRSAETLLILVDYFYMHGKHKNALALCSKIIKEHPTFDKIAHVYLKAARIYAEHLNLPDKAKKIIGFIRQQSTFEETVKLEADKLARALS